MAAPGWPVVLRDARSGVVLRPYARGDARVWSRCRIANQAWLSVWEPTPPSGTWAELNSPSAFRMINRELRRVAAGGAAMPFAICLTERGSSRQRLVGQLTLGNIVRRAFCSAYAGYWVDEAVAGRGIMPTALALAVDHAFGPGGLHRIEVNIRPENTPSRRVVEKLGFREESYHARYLHIDGAWRDHVGYAITSEEVAVDGGLMARWDRVRAEGRVPS
ncbi:MAG TPA: GNAT family protein [Micromonosporaceae bacterium]|jgi:ribosomal-protein-alanine N-acetyltransferase